MDHENFVSTETKEPCDVCGEPSLLIITGALDGCNYCGNQLALCRNHALELEGELREAL